VAILRPLGSSPECLLLSIMNKLFFRRLKFSLYGMAALGLFLLQGNAYGIVIRTVTQNGDAGVGSLRQAVADSASGDVVNFGVIGAIALTSGNITINTDIIISGPGARKLSVTGPLYVFHVSGGNVTISGLTIGPALAGFSLTGGTVTMNDCAVSGNTPGGGVFTAGGTTAFFNGCTLTGNHLDAQGGGGMESDGTSTLTNCTIAENSATAAGGGIENQGGTVTLKNCTVTNNSAGTLGGGIRSEAGGSFQLLNTIVANNTAGSGPDCIGTFVSNGYNLIRVKDGSTGFTNNVNHDIVGTAAAPRDPLLGALQNNGGATDTTAITSILSPAVDAAGPFLSPARDQRGFTRLNEADIGACEFSGKQPVALAQISSRAVVQTGDNVLIGGFIVTGTQAKSVILRAIGPSLSIPGKLPDPVLELYDSTNQLVASNDDWTSASNFQAISATGVAPTSVLESAILTALTPGSYTAIVRGYQGATGIGVVEAFDLDRTVNSRLANISTRAAVQTGDNVLIGGFIVLGPDSMPVIIRAIGPSLPIPNHMVDPSLELHDVNGTILAANDNWRSTQEAAIIATGVQPVSDAESAIVSTLAPGNYTAVLFGVNGTTGVAVVEVYGLL
jgi:hypothetical protein